MYSFCNIAHFFPLKDESGDEDDGSDELPAEMESSEEEDGSDGQDESSSSIVSTDEEDESDEEDEIPEKVCPISATVLDLSLRCYLTLDLSLRCDLTLVLCSAA